MNWPRSIDEIIHVGWSSILVLEAGLFFVALSLQLNIEPQNSGAVLVCASLLSELILINSSWFHLGNSIGYNSLKRDTYGKESPVYAHWKPAYKIEGLPESLEDNFIHFNATKELDGLRCRAHPMDFDQSNKELWNVRMTTRRIARRLSYLIAISAIFGTLLWGYGHRFL